MDVRRRVVVRGRVQGVGFRVFVASRAQARGVSGWARNCFDGSVEAVLEGSRDAVDALVETMREGPRSASVDEVDVCEEAVEGLRGFEVR